MFIKKKRQTFDTIHKEWPIISKNKCVRDSKTRSTILTATEKFGQEESLAF
jgi:hypothetical protein